VGFYSSDAEDSVKQRRRQAIKEADSRDASLIEMLALLDHPPPSIRERISECSSHSLRLNKWEAGFISSIREQHSAGYDLSGKQLQWLTRIYKKVLK